MLHIDPEAAIKRCLEMVPNQEDVVIDIVNVGNGGKGVIDGSTLPYGWIKDNNGWIEIGRVMEKYPNVNYRYLLTPSKELMDEARAVKGYFLSKE